MTYPRNYLNIYPMKIEVSYAVTRNGVTRHASLSATPPNGMMPTTKGVDIMISQLIMGATELVDCGGDDFHPDETMEGHFHDPLNLPHLGLDNKYRN